MIRGKNDMFKILFIVLIICITIGYAAIRSGLNINGTTHVKNATWDVHFENYQVTTNSTVTPTTSPSTPSGEKPTTVSYEVTLNEPGDIYEFTLDVVNSGTLDVMIESFSSKLNNVEIDNNNPIPEYLEYSVKYNDGVSLKNKQELVHNTTEKVKLRVKYRDDITTSALPITVQDLSFSFTITYVQDDGTSIPVGVDFATASWDELASVSPSRLQDTMEQGTTKDVDLGTFGIYKVRIANLSTPAECSGNGFSQTACGVVLEFADIITTHQINPYDSGITAIGNGNKGGWPASDMRTYIRNDIYNALPQELKDVIIDTYSVSGHGSKDDNNLSTTDKLYLLSTKEIWGKEDTTNPVTFDTAEVETRQLDYYESKETTTANHSDAIKQYNNENAIWWLRSAHSTYGSGFMSVQRNGVWAYTYSNEQLGVSPAFRIGTNS